MSVIISSFAGRPSMSLTIDSELNLQKLKNRLSDKVPIDLQRISHKGLVLLDDNILLFSLLENSKDVLYLSLSLQLLGGKGGFGSQLKASGGRMSRIKTTNFESCRDLSGRRIKTINDAKLLASYLEKEPEREREREREKLEKLNLKHEKGMIFMLNSPAAQRASLAKIPTFQFDEGEFNEEHEKTMDTVEEVMEMALKAHKVKCLTKPSTTSNSVATLKLWGDDSSSDDTEDEKPLAESEPLKKKQRIVEIQ